MIKSGNGKNELEKKNYKSEAVGLENNIHK